LATRVLDSCVTATESAIAADNAVERAARLDWEMLHRMRLGKFPDLGEPINPSETGILGPLYCLKGRAHRSHPPTSATEHRGPAEGKKTAPVSPGRDPVEVLRQVDAALNGTSAPAPSENAAPKASVERVVRKAKSLAARIRARRAKLNAECQAIQTERESLSRVKHSLEHEREQLQSEQAAQAARQTDWVAAQQQQCNDEAARSRCRTL
jgi:hypothetical protein